MNAMEHGNEYRADRPVSIRVLGPADAVRVQVTDLRRRRSSFLELRRRTSRQSSPVARSPRGWGLFLIEKMVDEARVTGDEGTTHRSSSSCACKEATMATHVSSRSPCGGATASRVIDLAGDIDAGAEAALQRGYDEAARDGGRGRAELRRADYINSTGIALIVGLLAQARARGRGHGLRADRPLPRDLRDHAAGRLHDDR